MTPAATAATTPRPWRNEGPYLVAQVLGGRPNGEVIGNTIASIHRAPWDTDAERVARAALISRSVNAHDALVALAEAIARECGPVFGQCQGCGMTSEFGDVWAKAQDELGAQRGGTIDEAKLAGLSEKIDHDEDCRYAQAAAALALAKTGGAS